MTDDLRETDAIADHRAAAAAYADPVLHMARAAAGFGLRAPFSHEELVRIADRIEADARRIAELDAERLWLHKVAFGCDAGVTADGRRESVFGRIAELEAEVQRLREAIRTHRDERGDSRCWLDDARLYAAIGEAINESEFRLPERCEFLASCERYWESRQPRPEAKGGTP